MIATALGVASAALHFEPPVALDRLLQFLQNAAAPCALFTLGVTVALRPLKQMPWEVPFLVADQDSWCIRLLVFLLLSLFGPFDPSWVYTARADGGAAAGAQRVRVRPAIRYLGRAGIRLGAARHADFGRHADHGDVAGEDHGTLPPLCSGRVYAAACRAFSFSISPRFCRGRWRR